MRQNYILKYMKNKEKMDVGVSTTELQKYTINLLKRKNGKILDKNSN